MLTSLKGIVEIDTDIDYDIEAGTHGAKKKDVKARTDDDGYMAFNMPS